MQHDTKFSLLCMHIISVLKSVPKWWLRQDARQGKTEAVALGSGRGSWGIQGGEIFPCYDLISTIYFLSCNKYMTCTLDHSLSLQANYMSVTKKNLCSCNKHMMLYAHQFIFYDYGLHLLYFILSVLYIYF